MKRTLIVTFAVVVLAAPIAALANQNAAGLTKANAARDCATLKGKMVRTAFAAAYATLGACVSSFTAVEQQNSASADQSCRTEMGDATFSLSHNGKTFDQFYGTGKKQANAYGNCVSLKAKNSSTAAQQAIQNPSRTCRAARTAMGAAPFALTSRRLERRFGARPIATATSPSSRAGRRHIDTTIPGVGHRHALLE